HPYPVRRPQRPLPGHPAPAARCARRVCPAATSPRASQPMSTRRAEQFTPLRTEGGLLPAGLLGRVAAGDTTLPGLTPDAYHLAAGERFGEVINRAWLRLVGAWAGFR